MTQTKIEWTNTTWNPLSGCTKISSGCLNCYAERMAKRLQAMGSKRYKNGFQLTVHEDLISRPLSWKTPKMIFVNSMSDLFHDDVSDRFIYDIFGTMAKASWHTFQVLTKRSDRLKYLNENIVWDDNIWMGVTVENNTVRYRIDDLKNTSAKVKFLSIEPMLEPLYNLDLTGIDWVIVGGESGPGARKMEKDWALDIKEQCARMHIPFFFKQWGGHNKKKTGRHLDKKIWDEMPPIARTTVGGLGI